MPSLSLSYIKEKWQHAGFQKYLKNTGWMFFGRFFTLGISFFVGIYIARYLGPSNYGLLSYITSFVGLFGFLASFGIDNIVSREIIKDHNKKDEIIGTGFYIKIVGSFLAIASVFVVSFFTTKDSFTLGLIWLFSLNFIPQSFNILETYFQSQVLSKKVVTAQVAANIISTILKISVIILNKGIFWLTLIYIIETSIYALILLFSFRKFGNHIRNWKFSTSVAKSLLRDSWPLMLSTVAVGIYMKIDQVMIKNMLGNEQAGIYAVAVKLSEVWYYIPGIISVSLFPAILNAKKINSEIYRKRLWRLFVLMFTLAVSISIPISFFSNTIVHILFGGSYISTVPILNIYIWSTVLVFVGTAISQHLISENYTKIFFYSNISGAVSNILLNIILIPRIGSVGAAIATLISYSFATLTLFIYKETRESLFQVIKIK